MRAPNVFKAIVIAVFGTSLAVAGDSYYGDGSGTGSGAGGFGDEFGGIASDVPGFDATRLTMSQTRNTRLGKGNAKMELTTYDFQTFLSKPIIATNGLSLLPHFQYKLNMFDFSGSASPFQDEDLHSLALTLFGISMRNDTPWLWGFWGRAELATDFQELDGDDFTFDLGAGVGYRFNPNFTLAFGAVVTNLNGNEKFYPGINFDWVVNEKVRCGIYGPSALVAYSPDTNWMLSARFDIGGGSWNITDNDSRSRTIELDDNRLGVYASRRISGNFWFTAGVGLTLWNELNYTKADGRELVGTDPDTALFYALSLRVKTW